MVNTVVVLRWWWLSIMLTTTMKQYLYTRGCCYVAYKSLHKSITRSSFIFFQFLFKISTYQCSKVIRKLYSIKWDYSMNDHLTICILYVVYCMINERIKRLKIITKQDNQCLHNKQKSRPNHTIYQYLFKSSLIKNPS